MAVSAVARNYTVILGTPDGEFVEREVRGSNARRVANAARKAYAQEIESAPTDVEVFGVIPPLNRAGDEYNLPKIRVREDWEAGQVPAEDGEYEDTAEDEE